MPRKTNTKKVLENENQSLPKSEAPTGTEFDGAAFSLEVGQAAQAAQAERPIDRFERLQAALDGPVCLQYNGQAIHGTLRLPPEGDTTYDLRVRDYTFRLAHVTAVQDDPVNGLTIFLNKL